MLLLHYRPVVRVHNGNRFLGESFEQQPLAARIEVLNDNKRCTAFSR